MADVDHPKTHVEDQDVETPRVQPESPQREGIDPLTESDTMYPREDVKGNAEKAARKEASEADTTAADKSAATVTDQNEVGAKANTPDANLPDDAKTANHKSSDKQNASPSNKPATK